MQEGKPAAFGTKGETQIMKDFKLYSHHQYAVMGTQVDKAGKDCLILQLHNKNKGGPGPAARKLHHQNTLTGNDLYESGDHSMKAADSFLMTTDDEGKGRLPHDHAPHEAGVRWG